MSRTTALKLISEGYAAVKKDESSNIKHAAILFEEVSLILHSTPGYGLVIAPFAHLFNYEYNRATTQDLFSISLGHTISKRLAQKEAPPLGELGGSILRERGNSKDCLRCLISLDEKGRPFVVSEDNHLIFYNPVKHSFSLLAGNDEVEKLVRGINFSRSQTPYDGLILNCANTILTLINPLNTFNILWPI
jgi:hypothetical protein